ncbi:O-antigen/teichoic acid export membrane protein [Marmoricola sp. OAE513]|uniref:oligosaccharide flippase family protein n=1 Tax=Marmoricola sp. OAE513 TaxID=2817894 RepID=UPI001AE8CB89
MLRSAAARIAAFGPQVLATFAVTRLIVEQYGVDTYSSFALALTLIALAPMNGLGVGAAVTDAIAVDGVTSDRARRVLLTSARVLACSGLVTALVALVLTAVGAWPTLLGRGAGPGWAFGAALAVYALAFVPGLGADVLLGVHRNHAAVAAQALTAPLVLGLVAILVLTGAPTGWVLITPAAALVGSNLVTAVLAGRAAGISWWPVLGALPRRRRHPGARILAVSGPMLVVSVTGQVGMQLDRVVVSHLAGPGAVAAYSLTVQVFAPAMALAAAAGPPLWPVFTEARARHEPGPPIGRLVAGFSAAAALGGVLLVLLSEPVAAVVSDRRITVGLELPLAAAALLVALSASAPVVASMMDAAGLRLLAIAGVLGLVGNLTLSWWLAHQIGPAGPLWASAVVVTLMTAPFLLRTRSLQRYRGRHRSRPTELP